MKHSQNEKYANSRTFLNMEIMKIPNMESEHIVQGHARWYPASLICRPVKSVEHMTFRGIDYYNLYSLLGEISTNVRLAGYQRA